MKKTGVNNFPFHPYFNIVCIAIFTVLSLVGFYVLSSNIKLANSIHFSEAKFYLLFIVANLGIIIFQMMRKMKSRLNLVVFLVSFVLYAISIALRQLFFEYNATIIIIAQGLAVCATLFTIMALEFFVLQLASNAMINDQDSFVVCEQDLGLLRGSVFFLTLMIALVPFIVLEGLHMYEIILWEAVLMVATIVLSVGNYYSIRRVAIVGKEEHVLEYRSIILYLRASRKQMQEYDVLKQKIESEVSGFEEAKNKELEDKARFEQIEASKPKLREEISTLSEQVGKYDIDAIHDRQAFAEQRMKAIQNQLWQEKFATEYNGLVDTIHSSKEQLNSTEYELEQTKQKVEEFNHSVKELGYRLEDDLEQQEDLKIKHSELAKKKAAYIDEYENGALEEKEAKKLQTQIEKLTNKEKDLNGKINTLETKIVEARTKESDMKQQLHALTEVDIPDYQYAITTITEQLATAEEKKQAIETEFENFITEHSEFNQMKKQLNIATEEEKTYKDLVAQRSEKQMIVDTDCLAEIAKIEQNIKDIDQSIHDKLADDATLNQQYQTVNDIITEFSANKQQILQKMQENKK